MTVSVRVAMLGSGGGGAYLLGTGCKSDLTVVHYEEV